MSNVITREELAEAIETGDVVVLEALPRSYWEAEHLPGAHALPLDEIDSLAQQLISDRDGAVVVYCSNTACNNSTIAADRLTALGYRNVQKFPGGKEEWIEAGLPVESAVST